MHRVVIVDDEEPNLQLYTALIERVLGGEARAFANPIAGVDDVAEREPSLIVVDYQMPEMDGLEFISKVRALPGRSQTPIMMLTGEGHLREEALRRGANVFLAKPFQTVDFIRHVRHLASWNDRPNQGVIGAPIERDRDTIARLHRAMEARDPAIARQMRRARDIALELAGELGLPHSDVEMLRWASLVYDIGMLGVPENVISLPTTLTRASLSVVHHHAETGASILAGSESPLMQAAESLALHHHERYDGDGYPSRLAGAAIPLLARVIAVADSFIAMTSARPHRPGMTFETACDEMRRAAGTQFDPHVVGAFERIKGRLQVAS